MPARSYPASGDPRLKTRSYKAIVTYWQQLKPEQCEAPRCLLPGVAIRYTLPRTQASLDVGHIQGRDTDTRTTWTITDTRPEHQRCNRAAGLAKAKAKSRASSTPRTRSGELSTTADQW